MSISQLLDAAGALVDRGTTPACQLAVARDDELLCFETFGAATNDTRFCVFSATKPIVASAVWLLIGEGLLDLTRPVSHYIPEFATNGKEHLTVEQVLLHTSGFPNAPMDPIEGADTVTRIKRFMEWELEWEPGSRFEYHALSAHWVLAELIERLTGEGEDFRDVVEARVCEPLGLPRLLGIPEEEQGDIAVGVRLGEAATTNPVNVDTLKFNEPAVRAAGVPGGGAFMTAATMARFYQALLHNPGGVWDAGVLADATTNIRCRYPDPRMNVAVNRTIGLVVAGDDGLHQFRYAMLGKDNSPEAFGHAGAHSQVAWADPATGTSFAFLKNGLQMDMLADAVDVLALSDLAAALR
ncbi:MAG TPA: serine hydrolase domain-containing protein [Acidimicrobiia bacterium]|nr:serine hydrolase domain-containing protein [Acidimicrobiia bacterium]